MLTIPIWTNWSTQSQYPISNKHYVTYFSRCHLTMGSQAMKWVYSHPNHLLVQRWTNDILTTKHDFYESVYNRMHLYTATIDSMYSHWILAHRDTTVFAFWAGFYSVWCPGSGNWHEGLFWRGVRSALTHWQGRPQHVMWYWWMVVEQSNGDKNREGDSRRIWRWQNL